MRNMEKERVYAILQPYHEKMLRAVKEGYSCWCDMRDLYSDKGRFKYKRTGANVAFETITNALRKELGGYKSIRIIEEGQTVKFYFDDQVVLRVKKGNGNKLGCNISTQAVLNFIDPQGVLPGISPDAVKVELVWFTDEIDSHVVRVEVVARRWDHIRWSYSLNTEESGLVSDLIIKNFEFNYEEEFSLVKPKLGAVKREDKS